MHLSKRIISAVTCGAALSSLLTGSLGTAVAAGETSVENVAAAVTATAPKNFDYAKALQYSIYFYDANMCGTEVGEHTRFSWRDDCHNKIQQVSCLFFKCRIDFSAKNILIYSRKYAFNFASFFLNAENI